MRECWLWAVGMTECFEERNAPACSCTPCNIGNAQHTHAHALAAHPHPRDVSALRAIAAHMFECGGHSIGPARSDACVHQVRTFVTP
jgi:hypothetical protein